MCRAGELPLREGPCGWQGDVREEKQSMTILQKNILKAVRQRPHNMRELQDELKVDGNRLRYTVSAMVSDGTLTMVKGKYAPGSCHH